MRFCTRVYCVRTRCALFTRLMFLIYYIYIFFVLCYSIVFSCFFFFVSIFMFSTATTTDGWNASTSFALVHLITLIRTLFLSGLLAQKSLHQNASGQCVSYPPILQRECFYRLDAFSLSINLFLFRFNSLQFLVKCFLFVHTVCCIKLTVIFRTLQWNYMYTHKHDTKAWIWRV